MSKKIIILTVVILVVAVVGVVWWQGRPTPTPKYTGSVEKIVIANQREYSIFNYIAQDKGYFKENGLEAEIKEYQSGPLAVTDLLASKVDVAIAGEFVGVSYIFTNDNLRILTQTSKEKVAQVVVRKDKGISKPTDLKGKKIGVTRKSVGEYFLGRFLTLNGMALSDVNIIDLSPLEMTDQINKGQIDAVATFDPYAYDNQKKLGDKAITWSAQGDQDTYALLYSTDEFIKNHPQIIERYLRSLKQAEQYDNGHETEVKNLATSTFHYDDSYIQYIWPKITFSLVLNQELILALENQARWAIQNKLIGSPKVPNYLNFIYFDGLVKVKPEAVTIIH